MRPRPPILAWLTLFPAGGVLSAALWRAETERRGWAGLEWLGWFHWAVPFGLAMFVASALVVIRGSDAAVDRAQIVRVGVALAAFAVGGHLFTQFALFRIYTRAPSFAGSPQIGMAIGLLLGLVLVPANLAALLAALRMWPGWRRASASLALWVAAIPLACAVTGVDHEVEAIKRGGPVPLLYVALGLLFLPPRARPREVAS
jgi:hypothetical protein